MIDRLIVEGLERDAGNERKSHEKHGVTANEAEQVFFNQPLLVIGDAVHSTRESRWHAMGMTDDAHHLHLTFTLRRAGRSIRVISARDMHRKERAIYAQSHEEH